MLWRKTWRDINHNKAAYLACIAVIAIGLMVFTLMAVVVDSLSLAQESFYLNQRFADGFARVRGISQSQLNSLATTEGIERIEGRIVRDARVAFSGRTENVYLRLISIVPDQHERLNDVLVADGTLPVTGSRGVVIDTGFLVANELKLGDIVPVVISGNQVDLVITGGGQSPEFVYAMRNSMDIYPDSSVFGIAYLPLDVMRSLFGEEHYNDVSFTLAEGYNYEEVESHLKPRLEPFGLESVVARKNQLSAAMLEQELVSMESMVSSIPLLFLTIAATILYILLKRMVEQQRGQIGILKSFGYSSHTILYHYISYALIIAAAGGIVGCLLGFWFSFPLMGVYDSFFNLPNLSGQFSLYYLVIGVLLSVAFGALAGYFGSKEVLKLQPAEAMRPPAPPKAKQTLLEGWRSYWNALTVQGKMATRNLFRNLARSAFTLIGVTFAFSLIATTGYFLSITDIMIVDQFTKVQTHDVKFVFAAPKSSHDAKLELSRLPGVNRFEAFLEAPAVLKHSWYERATVILGIEQNSELYIIRADDGSAVTLPTIGIVLSQKLADNLGASVGSQLEVESPYAKDSPVYVEVAEIVPQYLGTNAYMDITALNRLFGQGNISTSALLAVEDEAFAFLKDHYQESTGVFSVEEKSALLKKFNELMASSGYTYWILALFGMLTGFAVIYNSGIVSLSERKRELASLRVMGMSPGEVLQVLTFEQWFISLFGMLLGIPTTIMFLYGMGSAMNTDLFTFPVRIELRPFLIGAFGTILSIWITHKTIYAKVKELSMVEVLKERD